MQTRQKFADIVFPQNVGRLTYLLPDEFRAVCRPGIIAEASLRGKIRKGMVVSVHTGLPALKGKKISPLLGLSGDLVFPGYLASLLTWVSEYYMSSEGLALKGLLFKETLATLKREGRLQEKKYDNPHPPLPSCNEDLSRILSSAGKSFSAFLFRGKGIPDEISLVMELIGKIRNIIIMVPEVFDLSYFLPYLEEKATGRWCVLQSGMGKRATADAYRGLYSGKYDIVIGTMQTVFAPIRASLIIVFREESELYKHEETPMYSVRDTAVKRASLEKIPVLLTSLAPSFESFQNCRKGKYSLIENAADTWRPPVRIINAAGSEGLVTAPLKKAIENTLASGMNVLVMINRKGHSVLKCADCGHMEICGQCGVPFVFHSEKKLICPRCGSTLKVPSGCPVCKGPHFRFSGAGTERVHEILKRDFRTEITLIDSEHEPRQGAESGRIIVGTEFAFRRIPPFSRYGLTAVLNADIHLSRPDFRIYERFFQHAMRLAGLTAKGGDFYLQTFDWRNPLFDFIRNYDYAGFFDREITKRSEFHYPPFYRIASLTLKAGIRDFTPEGGREFELLGPVPKRKGNGELEFLIKCRADKPVQDHIRRLIVKAGIDPRDLKIDVDPLVFA